MRRPLERARILRRQDDQPTLPARVKRILRKYGATMLLPGPSGILQYGFQSGNYKESTGNTVGAVDQQIGLVQDAVKAGERGADLLSDWDFLSAAAWQANGGAVLVASDGIGSTSFPAGSNYPTVLQYGATEVSKLYEVEVRAKKNTPDTVRFLVGSVTTNITDTFQTYRFVYQAVAASTLFRVQVAAASAAAGSFEIDYFRVRELTGIQAQQATSGYQPYLRQVPKTLGPEMWANDYSGFTLGTGWSISGNKLIGASVAVTQSAFKNVGLALGKSYVARYRISSLSAGTVRAIASSGVSGAVRSAVGDYEDVITPSAGSGNYGFIPFAAFTGEIEVLSIREVLEWTYAWQFDGGDDRMSLSAVPFGTGDDFVMISGCRPAAALDMTIIGLGNSGQTNPAIVLGTLPSGQPRMWARNDAGTFVQVQGPSSVVGSDVVLTGRKKGSVMELRVNGVAAPTAAWPANSMAINTATLGALTRTTVGGFFSGNLHPQIMINGAAADAEIAVLEKFVARWQGRNL